MVKHLSLFLLFIEKWTQTSISSTNVSIEYSFANEDDGAFEEKAVCHFWTGLYPLDGVLLDLHIKR